jgi:hypothetical protein
MLREKNKKKQIKKMIKQTAIKIIRIVLNIKIK